MSISVRDLHHVTDAYRDAGQEWPASTRDIASWAIQNGYWQPSRSDQVKLCSDQLARALREDYIMDPQGRKVRAKHVAKDWHNGELIGLWDDIRTASRDHMAVAFRQRREQIVGDCKQLKTDVDSYNENGNTGQPINLVLDFTADVEELECVELEEMLESVV